MNESEGVENRNGNKGDERRKMRDRGERESRVSFVLRV